MKYRQWESTSVGKRNLVLCPPDYPTCLISRSLKSGLGVFSWGVLAGGNNSDEVTCGLL